MDSPRDFPIQKAAIACNTCRKQKRKCDKLIPACSLCRRMSRSCDYSETKPAPTAEDYESLRQKIFDLEDRLSSHNGSVEISNSYVPIDPLLMAQSNLESSDNGFGPIFDSSSPSYQEPVTRFPAIALLDGQAFKYGRVQVPIPPVQIPREVSDVLGDFRSIDEVIGEYFATIHTWFPFISKRRLTPDTNSVSEAGPDLVLLFLCMKLVVTQPQQEGVVESAQIPIYHIAKRFLALMETAGMATLNVLQSYVLVSIYEFGHAIYPAAWMTTGACSRYVSLLGIDGHEEVAVLLGQPASWIEIEERRRVWYAVSILDRCVAVGSLGHSLATRDFQEEDPLPVDDEAWDNGIASASNTANFSTPFTEPIALFAHLCQASNVLGKAMHHLQDRSDKQIDHFEQSSDLQQNISEQTDHLISEANRPNQDYLSLVTPLAVSLKALCILHDLYTSSSNPPNPSNSGQETAIPPTFLTSLKQTTQTIQTLSTQILTHISTNPNNTSKINPLIMNTLYTAASNSAWLVRENGDEEFQLALDSLRFCLRRLGERWRCAAEYLRILEAQEFSYAISGV